MKKIRQHLSDAIRTKRAVDHKTGDEIPSKPPFGLPADGVDASIPFIRTFSYKRDFYFFFESIYWRRPCNFEQDLELGFRLKISPLLAGIFFCQSAVTGLQTRRASVVSELPRRPVEQDLQARILGFQALEQPELRPRPLAVVAFEVDFVVRVTTQVIG